MDKIDEEISFFEERIKEFFNESMKIKEYRVQLMFGIVRDLGIGVFGCGVEYIMEENYDVKGVRFKIKMYVQIEDLFEFYDRKDRV